MPDLLICPLALTPLEMAAQLGSIFYFIVCPMLLLIGVGFLIQRRIGLDPQTLSRINFSFCVPGIIFYSVVGSTLPLAEAAHGFLFTVCMVGCMALFAKILAHVLDVPRDQHNAMMMSTMFYNAGNYGLPLQDLAFRDMGLSAEARATEVFVMVGQNIMTFTVGILLASGGRTHRSWRDLLRHISRFPPLYALSAALLIVLVRHLLGDDAPAVARALKPFWDAAGYIKESFIGLALLTLGAQLALVKPGETKYPVRVSVFMRLLIGPALGLGLIYALGLKGFLAQGLWISSGLPSAVNSMLLCLEFDNHPGYLARAIFYGTLFSPITLTLVIFFAQGNFLERLAMP